MKIYEELNKDFGRAFIRISKAFHDYAPECIEFVDSPDKADVNLIHSLGSGELQFMSRPNKVIVQHCYLTGSSEYTKYWKDSLLTVSFHNLKLYTDIDFNFLSIPWGVEPSVFSRTEKEKDNLVFTTGHVAETENIDKVYDAVKYLNTFMIHTGENFKWDSTYYKYHMYMDDEKFAHLLNRTKYTVGLRSIEGFEMHCAEGLFCGARPIVPKLDTYRWYDGLCHYIDMDKDIVEQLIIIFSGEFIPLTFDEYREAHERFSWVSIMSQFYDRLLKV
jgi:hypothetical protein